MTRAGEKRHGSESRLSQQHPPAAYQVTLGDADLVMLGFTDERLERARRGPLRRFPNLRDVLFVSAEETIFIE